MKMYVKKLKNKFYIKFIFKIIGKHSKQREHLISLITEWKELPKKSNFP